MIQHFSTLNRPYCIFSEQSTKKKKNPADKSCWKKNPADKSWWKILLSNPSDKSSKYPEESILIDKLYLSLQLLHFSILCKKYHQHRTPLGQVLLWKNCSYVRYLFLFVGKMLSSKCSLPKELFQREHFVRGRNALYILSMCYFMSLDLNSWW